MLRVLCLLLIGFAPVPALAEGSGPLTVLAEGAALDFLPGDDGRGETGIRINRGPVLLVTRSDEALPWSPNRPVIVSELQLRPARPAPRYREADYVYYPRHHRRHRHGSHTYLRLDLGDVTIHLGHPHRKYRPHVPTRSLPATFRLPSR